MSTVSAPLRAALYVDFDNVFSSLAAIDEWAAWSFAAEPARWLGWLAAGAGGTPRRLLVRRCYLNPAGWSEPEPGSAFARWLGQPRVYYSRFRSDFVRAGFQVVDCPRLARLKNGADMVMALDIVDALVHPTRFDEFLILSGDSDFTPLLHRIRAHDRLSLVVTHPLSAQAYRAAADAVVAFGDFADAALAEATPTPTPAAIPATATALGPLPRTAAPPSAAGPAVPDAVADPGDPAAQRAAILGLLRQAVAASEDPLHLPALGKLIHMLGGGWLYDPARHERPSLQQPSLADDPHARLLAELQAALGGASDVPRLGPEALEFALHGLAGLLPLAAAPGPEQRAALIAEAMAAGLDLPARAVDALVNWLLRARVDWRATPDADTPARFGRAFFAELTRQAAAAGVRLPAETLAELRDWIGLSPKPSPEGTPEAVPEETLASVPADGVT